jgi:hypothetical protein
MLHAQKMRAAPVFLPLISLWHPQGVQGDSMGVGAVKIGRSYAPDHHRRHQEAPKRIPATPVAFWGLSLCVREVEIINVHIFAHQHSRIYYVLHM